MKQSVLAVFLICLLVLPVVAAPTISGGLPFPRNITISGAGGSGTDVNISHYLRDTSLSLNPGTLDANLFRNTTGGGLLLRGGTMTAGTGGGIALYGKDYSPDAILFFVPDTTTSIDQLVATFVGQISPPYLDMEMHQIKRILNPTDAQDAVTLNYAGLNYAALGSLANYYLRDTSQSLTGNSIFRSVTNDVLSLYGSTSTDPYGGMIHLYGEDAVAQSGGLVVSVGNAAGTAPEVVFSALGRTNTPYLDLNDNQIKNMADPTVAQDAVTLNKLCTYVGNNSINTTYGLATNNSYYFNDTSRPLTGSLIYRNTSDDILDITGGTKIAPFGGKITLTGGGLGAYPGGIILAVTNAGGTAYKNIMSVVGGTDTPILNMHWNQIYQLLDPTVGSGAATKNYVDIQKGNDTSYAYLLGRTPGQTLNGGVLATDNLTLNGTISTTKTFGNINLNPLGGSVGIGSANPVYGLYLEGSGNPSAQFLISKSYAGGSQSVVFIGTGSSTYAANNERGLAYFWNNGSITTQISSYSNSYFNGGNVSVGTPTSTATFDVVGTDVRLRMFGAGTLMTDANGRLYVISDDKYKTAETSFTKGLAAILNTTPITYKFNAASGLDTVNTYLGFSAQQLLTTIPEAVFSKADVTYKTVDNKTVEVPVLDKDGKQTTTRSINDRAIIATLVNAIKEQQIIINNRQGQIDNLTKRMEELEKKVGI